MSLLTDRDLLDVLCELNHRFSHMGGGTDINVLERYSFFLKRAEKGKRCGYAMKYRDIFLQHDYETVRDLILEAARMITDLEPGDKPPVISQPYEEEEDGN